MEINNPKHLYLNEQNEYLNGFNQSLKYLQKFMAPNQKKKLLKDLQVLDNNFNEVTYLQVACETSVASYFAQHYQKTFVYEAKVHPPRDVDCQFSFDNYTFNIEVKCADFSKLNSMTDTPIRNYGRSDNKDDKTIEDLQKVFSSSSTPLNKEKNMDNKLKDYLISAHEKFNDEAKSKELNVLVVCCNSPEDMEGWHSYMYGNQGLFTEKPFADKKSYNNVDVVLLSNIYHRHYEYWNKGQLSNNWDFERAFNIICSNPNRKLEKKETIEKFIELVPNHSIELSQYAQKRYLENKDKDSLLLALEATLIPHFNHEVLMKNNEKFFDLEQ